MIFCWGFLRRVTDLVVVHEVIPRHIINGNSRSLRSEVTGAAFLEARSPGESFALYLLHNIVP